MPRALAEALAVFLIFATIFFLPFDAKAVDQAENTREDVEILFLRGDYRTAITDWRQGEDLDPGKRYLLGLCYMKDGEHEAAALIWEALAEGPLAERVIPSLAGALLKIGKTEQADALYTRYRREFPRGQSLPAVLLGQAQTRQRLGLEEDARNLLLNLRRQYPFSNEAREANRRLARSEGEFTVQLGNFTELSRARITVEKLREEGFDGYLSRVTDEKISYRVRSGNFKSREKAIERGREIREKTGLDYFTTYAR